MNSKREPAQACVQSRPSNDRLPPQAEPIQLTGVWRMRDTQQADAVLGGRNRDLPIAAMATPMQHH